MKTKIKFISYIFMITPSIIFAQSKELTKVQVIGDVKFIISALENTSVAPYEHISKENFHKKMSIIESSLVNKDNVNEVDFYKAVQPIVNLLKDGHTYLYLEDYFDKNDYYLFPFELSISKKMIMIRNIKNSYESKIKREFVGKKIKSINSFSTSQILNLLNTYSSGENQNTRLALSDYIFNDIYNIFYLNNNHLTILFDDNSKLELSINKKSEFRTNNNEENEDINYYYKIINNKYAVLTFNSFLKLKSFKIFLVEMFKNLKTQKIKNLIIDIRDNGGGDSELGDELLKYFCINPFTQYEKTLLKYSDLSKAMAKIYLSKDTEKLKSFLSKENGMVETIDKSNALINPYPLDKRYDGNVFLLTSGRTFSSAADFSNAFKFYKVGMIVGEETGGFVISPGELSVAKLPNSGLTFFLSSSKDYDIGVQNNEWHGIFPDIKINSENALQYTVDKLIK